MNGRSWTWLLASLLAGAGLSMWHAAVTVDHLSLQALTDFRAAEPFQYRILVPAIARMVTTLLPVAPLAVYLTIEALCWTGILIVARKALGEMAARAAEQAPWISWTILWPLVAHLMKPQYFRPLDETGRAVAFETIWREPVTFSAAPNLYYPYDVPAALFVLWLFVTMHRLASTGRRRTLLTYLAVFAAAAVNRESAILVVPAFVLLMRSRLSPTTLWLTVIAQVGWVILVQGSLRALVGGTVGVNPQAELGAYEWHAKTNFATLLVPACFVSAVPLFAGGLYLPLVRWRARLTRWNGLALGAYVVPVVVLGFCLGQVLEARVFVEAVPVIWLAAVQVMDRAEARGET
jgi:hypothetical protein